MKHKIYTLIAILTMIFVCMTMTTQAADVTKKEIISSDQVDLYLEITYPVSADDYTEDSYSYYENALKYGETIFSKTDATKEELIEALKYIQISKASLTTSEIIITPSSNKEAYSEDWSLSKMLDGKSSTKTWIKDKQEVGDYIKFSFSKPILLNEFSIEYPDDNCKIKKGNLEVSLDNKKWTTVGIIDDIEGFNDLVFFCNDTIKMQYFRILITAPTENYTQISEVAFKYESDIDKELNKNELYYYITQACELNATDYTEESWLVLDAAIRNAKETALSLNSTSGVIKASTNALKGSMNVLIKNNPENVSNIFSDITHGAWYETSVQYVYDKNLMSGSNGLFKPTDDITRAQLVTILYRLAGSPIITDTSALTEFTDIEKDKYYTDSVCWAYANGIATGNDCKFEPSGKLTRQQMATFFFRYADYTGLDTETRGDITEMINADKVSEYAKDAIEWAVGTGLISGSEVTVEGNKIKDLNPRGNTTRAQVATIIMRFCY